MMIKFKNENSIRGLSNTSGVRAGISNVDDSSLPEAGFKFPTIVDPQVSWIDYRCWVTCHLDSGIAIHQPLPQRADNIDSLASGFVDDANLDTNKLGVNVKSAGSFKYIQQRMAYSKYRFCLKGWAMRVAFQVPIPGIKTVGGVPAVPDDENPQRGYNVVAGNYSGVPVFFAEWELWYTVLVPPTSQLLPPPNLAEHIRADVVLPPDGHVQVPYSQPDSNATTTTIPPLENPVAG